MGLLKVIEWTETNSDAIVHKVDMAGNSINRGSVLNVRESQVAIFCDKGRNVNGNRTSGDTRLVFAV